MSGVLMEDTSQNATSTPASPSGAAPAVSTPAPAASPTAPAKPTSALSAMEGAAARSAADPASAQPGAKPTSPAAGVGTPGAAAAIAQPAKPVTGEPAPKGPIPFDEHDKAIKNARVKATEEAVRPYAWAKGLDPVATQADLALVQRLRADPKKFSADLIGELQGLSDELPPPDLRSPDGRTQVYSASAMKSVVDYVRNQVMREVNGHLQPIQDERRTQEQAAATKAKTDAAIAEGRTVIQEAITHARTLPQFTDNEKAISAKLDEITPEVRGKVGLVAAMYMAYAAVLADRLTQAGSSAEHKVLTDQKRKAAAGAGNVTPNGPVPTQAGKKPGNVRELAAHMERLAGAAT